MPVEKEERKSQNLLMRIPANLNGLYKAVLCCVAYLLLCTSTLFGQSSIDTLLAKIDPQQYANSIAEKAKKLEDKLVAKSMKVLDKLQEQEEKIFHKLLATKDSIQAKANLADIKGKYTSLKTKLKNPAIISQAKQYIPQLDSLSTSLKFLTENGIGGKVKDAFAKTESLKDKFQQAEEIKNFIKERKEQLKLQLEKLGMMKQLKKINKEVYYYATQIKEYKEILKDPRKIEKKAIELLSKTKIWKDFFRKNSMLANLFPMPGNPDGPLNMASLAGLQTRTQVNNLIQQQIQGAGANGMQQFQQNINAAQSQLNELKNKIIKAGGSSSDDELPDFKPNNQKTKSFLQRLEYGTNIQTQKASSFFPVTSDIALSVGYKLNEKSIIGMGSSFKMGWGQGWQRIKITSQGVGFRSFVDYKLKGSFWISGGYEMNYRNAINSITQVQNLSAWQQSGLIGISKVISLKTKLFKKTSIKLLWDFMSYRQVPVTQPILFRVGYNF